MSTVTAEDLFVLGNTLHGLVTTLDAGLERLDYRDDEIFNQLSEIVGTFSDAAEPIIRRIIFSAALKNAEED